MRDPSQKKKQKVIWGSGFLSKVLASQAWTGVWWAACDPSDGGRDSGSQDQWNRKAPRASERPLMYRKEGDDRERDRTLNVQLRHLSQRTRWRVPDPTGLTSAHVPHTCSQ